MSRESVCQNLAQAIVDVLKSAGHVLIARGGEGRLVKELEGHVKRMLEAVLPDIARGAALGDIESTFGSERADEAVENLVQSIADALLESEHVEDVFGEDAVIQRDVFRAVRATLLSPDGAELVSGPAAEPVVVAIGTLGYVAATAARRAELDLLQEALERAARAVRAELRKIDEDSLDATFEVATEGPDARIELEEAIAEELEALVDMRLVKLPSQERRVQLPAGLTAVQLATLRARLELVVTQRSRGTADHRVDEDEIVLTITPMSEPDAEEVESMADRLANELTALLTGRAPVEAPAERAPASEPQPASKKAPASEKAPASVRPVAKKAPSEKAPPSEKPAKAAPKAPAAKKAPAKPKKA